MSRLEDLIQRLCPDGVEYKPLWSITFWDKKFNGVSKEKQPVVLSFKHVSAEILKSLKTPVGDIRLLATGKFEGNTTIEMANTFINEGTVIAIPSGGAANIKYHNGLFVDGGNILCVSRKSNELSLKYLYYYLLKENDFIQSCYRGGSVQHPEMVKILNMEIPVPPMEVQLEIVRILDKFTELTADLTADLTAELTTRKKQYEYYLNSFYGANVEEASKIGKLVRLSDIGEFQRGKRFCHRDDCESGIPAIHYGELYTFYGISADKTKTHITEDLGNKMRYAETNDLIIVGAGENRVDIGVGVAWLGKEKVAVHDACYRFRTKQNPKYISYYLRSGLYHNQIFGKVSEGKICAISSDSIGASIIGIPSIEEQQRIVDILDRFDTYCNDITQELPAEIKARHQQYEYYRDKLLTFKEAK